MERPLVYLAVPYTHADPAVMLERFIKVNRVAAHLMNDLKLTVFSPISQNHPIALQCGLPVNWEYWAEFDRNFISCCKTLFVLKLDGWERSKGVAAEITIAHDMGIPVIFLEDGA